MRAMILAAAMLYPLAAYAQAPAARSGGGGGVGASVDTPTTPQGKAPPGTPTGETTGDRALRDVAGQNALGKTDTPLTAVPGNTTGQDSGVRK
jgi:hypothetical protein